MSESRGRLGVVFLTVMIDLIGFGIVIPILPYYAQRFGAGAMLYGLLLGGFSGMQFLSTTVLGRLSDRWGRRPLLLFTMVVNTAGYLAFAFAGSYAVLLAARLVSGFAGGNLSVAQAYVADVSSVESRSRAMGRTIGTAFGLGFVLGPAIGGLSSAYGGHAAPGLVAAGLAALNLVLAWRILPESLPESRRSRRPLWEFAHFGTALARPELRWLLVVWFLAPVAFAGYTVALPVYTTAALGWKATDLGWLFVVIGSVAAIVQGWGFGRISKRTGDRPLLIIGTFGMAAAILVVPFAGSSASLYGWTVLLAFSNSLFGPAATGMVSVLADPTEQGTILGVAQSLAGLGRLIGPEATGGMYDRGGPVLAFSLAAAVMVVGGFAAMAVPRRVANPSPPPVSGPNVGSPA